MERHITKDQTKGKKVNSQKVSKSFGYCRIITLSDTDINLSVLGILQMIPSVFVENSVRTLDQNQVIFWQHLTHSHTDLHNLLFVWHQTNEILQVSFFDSIQFTVDTTASIHTFLVFVVIFLVHVTNFSSFGLDLIHGLVDRFTENIVTHTLEVSLLFGKQVVQ